MSLMPRQQQNPSQLLSKSHSTLSKITLTSRMSSITTQFLANLTTLLRQHSQVSFSPCTNMPISHLILIRNMKKLLCIWSGTYWRLVIQGCSCEAHCICSAVMSVGIVVCLHKVKLMIEGEEHTAITVHWVSNGIDRCHVGFLCQVSPSYMSYNTNDTRCFHLCPVTILVNKSAGLFSDLKCPINIPPIATNLWMTW